MNQALTWSYFQNDGVDAFAGTRPRLEFLAKQVRAQFGKDAVVLNIGVRGGVLEELLRQAGCTPVSLDPDARAVAQMQELGFPAYVGRLEDIPFEDGQMDAVVVTGVLQHLPADVRAKGLAEIARVLKPTGQLFVTVPYLENLARSHVACPACGNSFHRRGHVESFDCETLRAELDVSFQVLELRRRAFVSYEGGLARKFKSAVKAVLGRMGEQIARPNLYVRAARKA